jgi:thiamine kinase-like enzyme
MGDTLREIFEKFITGSTFLKADLSGSGHIHDTYYVESQEKDHDDYILQKLNTTVFRNIPELQENIERVTQHFRQKLTKIPGADPKRETLTLVSAKNGKSWITDSEGNYWRMYIFITGQHSYDIVDTPEKSFEGGKAIGRFQAMLSDLPGPPLHETIPYFHDIEKRLESFYRILAADPVSRAVSVTELIDFVNPRAEIMKTILNLGKEGKIPLRITHNDTKFNNILFDENEKALCVIDLDTVMPGYVHYDFGDAIRTAANVASEDEEDLSKIRMDISLFEAHATGYLSETRKTLNSVEKEYLAFAPILITFIMGLRFLTDYIDGDHYFKIDHENHNLQRAKAQFKLVESMEGQYDEMKRTIKQLG